MDSEFFASLVGKPVAEAQSLAEAAGYRLRVTVVDGEPNIVTMDFRMDRINVAVDNGVVTAFRGRG